MFSPLPVPGSRAPSLDRTPVSPAVKPPTAQVLKSMRLDDTQREGLDRLASRRPKCLADLPDALIFEIFKALKQLDPSRWGELRKLLDNTPLEHALRFRYIASGLADDTQRELQVFLRTLGTELQVRLDIYRREFDPDKRLQLALTEYAGIHSVVFRKSLQSGMDTTLQHALSAQLALRQGALGQTPDEFRRFGQLLIVKKLAAAAVTISKLISPFPGLEPVLILLSLYRVSSFIHLDVVESAVAIVVNDRRFYSMQDYLLQLARLKLKVEGLKAFKDFLCKHLSCSQDQLGAKYTSYLLEAFQFFRQQGKVSDSLAILRQMNCQPSKEGWRFAQCAAEIIRKGLISTKDIFSLVFLASRGNFEVTVMQMFYSACFAADTKVRCEALTLSDRAIPVEFKRILASIERYTTDGMHNDGMDRRLCNEGYLISELYRLQSRLNQVSYLSLEERFRSPAFVKILADLRKCEAFTVSFPRVLKSLIFADLQIIASVAPYLSEENQILFIKELIEALTGIYAIDERTPVSKLCKKIPSQHLERELRAVTAFIFKISSGIRQEVYQLNGWNLFNAWVAGGLIPLDIDLAISWITAGNIIHENHYQFILEAILERLNKLAVATNDMVYLQKAENLINSLDERFYKEPKLYELVRVCARQCWFDKGQEILQQLMDLHLETQHVDELRVCLGGMMGIHGSLDESVEMLAKISDSDRRIQVMQAVGALSVAFRDFEESAVFYSASNSDSEESRLAHIKASYLVAITMKDLALAKRILAVVPEELKTQCLVAYRDCQIDVCLEKKDFAKAEALALEIDDPEQQVVAIIKIVERLCKEAKKNVRRSDTAGAENQRLHALKLIDSIVYCEPRDQVIKLLQELCVDYEEESNNEYVTKVKNLLLMAQLSGQSDC